jgi:hypothetical protein
MSIPEIPLFEEFLTNLSVHKPEHADGYEAAVAIEAQSGIDRGRNVEFNEVRLWYKVNGDFNLDSLVRKVQAELQSAGHDRAEPAILALLCAYAMMPKDHDSCVRRFNKVLNAVIDAELMQLFVFPVSSPKSLNFRFGSFKLGPLDSRRLSKTTRSAGSDYYERYSTELDGKLAIERDIAPIRIIDWSVFTDQWISTVIPNLFTHVWDNYFLSLARATYSQFWDLFESQQELTTAIGATYLDSLVFQRLPKTHGIAIFLNIGQSSSGYVAPVQFFLNIDFGKCDVTIPNAERQLRKYGIKPGQESNLAQTIRSYSRFVTRATKHFLNDRAEEAFLHYIIALDLLLGEKDASNKSITTRVAALVHNHFGHSLETQRKIALDLYDKRSRYVHQGASIEASKIDIAKAICHEVLLCLLRCNMNANNHFDGFVDQWLRNLDYIAITIEAQKQLRNEDWLENGIEPPS